MLSSTMNDLYPIRPMCACFPGRSPCVEPPWGVLCLSTNHQLFSHGNNASSPPMSAPTSSGFRTLILNLNQCYWCQYNMITVCSDHAHLSSFDDQNPDGELTTHELIETPAPCHHDHTGTLHESQCGLGIAETQSIHLSRNVDRYPGTWSFKQYRQACCESWYVKIIIGRRTLDSQ